MFAQQTLCQEEHNHTTISTLEHQQNTVEFGFLNANKVTFYVDSSLCASPRHRNHYQNHHRRRHHRSERENVAAPMFGWNTLFIVFEFIYF